MASALRYLASWRAFAAILAIAVVAMPAAGVSVAGVRSTPTITEYRVQPGTNPLAIVSGADGALWFTEVGPWSSSPGRIGRIAIDGAVTEYPLGERRRPSHIAAGHDGNLWFTEPGAHSIGRLTPAGATTFFPLPTNIWPDKIAAAHDALWFSEFMGSALGRITLDGTVAEYPIRTGARPTGVFAAPNGSIWFGAENPGLLGRMSAAGAVTGEEPLPYFESPDTFAAAPDGTVWVADHNYAYLDHRRADGSRIERLLLPSGGATGGIAIGPDRALWFTVRTAPRIGRWTRWDGFTEFAIPSGALPWGITAGPDGAMWFVVREPDGIARIAVPPDERPPQAKAAHTAGRPGKNLTISYSAWDDRGETRERIMVFSGRTRLWLKSTRFAIRDGGSVTWRIPRRIRGDLRVSVQAWDRAGNASAISWASIRVR